MKKLILLLLPIILLSCSDDNKHWGSVEISEKWADKGVVCSDSTKFHPIPKAVLKNLTNQEVKGYLRFKFKEEQSMSQLDFVLPAEATDTITYEDVNVCLPYPFIIEKVYLGVMSVTSK